MFKNKNPFNLLLQGWHIRVTLALFLLLGLLICCSPSHSPDFFPENPNDSEDFNSEEPSLPSEGLERSIEATKLLNYIKEISGKQMLSGCMANVNWNINEAIWIYQHTDKFPAINCFDYIHLMYSPANWIDYSNTIVAEKWWKDGGIVAAMWHWNMLANDKKEYTATPGLQNDGKHTSFDLRKIDDPNSKEYLQLIADIDKIAGYLKLLRDKNIPVLWRPLHEAAGNYYRPDWGNPYWSDKVGLAWFWWGYYGPEYFKKLWHLMYNRFTNTHKLNNLIWVWTFEPTGTETWFPGVDYVDITGGDIYGANAETAAKHYKQQHEKYPELPSAMSECGSVAKISSQWENGAKWTYFTTWYDYGRTNSLTEPDFSQKEHEQASADWWIDAFECDFIISRDEVPNLKNENS